MSTINKLADTDSPALFGLPMNIDKSVQRYNTQQLKKSMLSLMAIGSESTKFDRELWTQQLAPTLKLWKQLMKQIKEGGIPKIRNQLLDSDNPIDAFVYMEVKEAFYMLQKVNESVDSIIGVLKGKEFLTRDIQNNVNALLKGRIPNNWISLWEGPENPTTWMKSFAKRVFNLNKWYNSLKAGGLLNQDLQLSDLFHPEVFLNVIRQKSARRLNFSVDQMKLACSFETTKLITEDTIKIKGLWLQGSGFNQKTGHLINPQDNLPEFLPLPICYLCWIPESEEDPYPDQVTGQFPVFISSTREKILCQLKIPNTGDINERIIAGVAILLSTDE